MTKKLIFCFDGTGYEPSDAEDFFHDESISNVLKLHIFFGGVLNPNYPKSGNIDGQRSFYYKGVGTYSRNKLKRLWNAAVAPRKGDVERIIKQASEDLKTHYEADDEIYIFGFSRGAAIARLFAAHHQGKQVKFLGLFDTVAAKDFGIDLKQDTYPPSRTLFSDFTLHKNVEEAVHLVSLDERRLIFQPTLINKTARNNVLELWFAGAHSDVGGGFWFDGLSDITLEFMLDCAHIKGLTSLNKMEPSQYDYACLESEDLKEEIYLDDLNLRPLSGGMLHAQKL